VDDRPPETLSGRITGPIAQTGKSSAAAFTWTCEKCPTLPDRGTITYFARATDCNPSPGRKPVESSRFKIKLVKPASSTSRRSRRPDCCWRGADRLARATPRLHVGRQWLARAPGRRRQALAEIEDKQEVAGRAGRAVAATCRPSSASISAITWRASSWPHGSATWPAWCTGLPSRNCPPSTGCCRRPGPSWPPTPRPIA